MTGVSTRPLISVIVPVRNNAMGIAHVLACLEIQTLAADYFEVIIADDGSQPGQVPQVDSPEGRLRMVRCPPRTSYAARNTASLSARGAVLAFCDSDCLPDPRWLEEGLAAAAGAELAAGQVVFVPPAQPTLWSLLTIDMFLDQERDVRQSCAVTANLFVHRALFERLRGFDESLASGGDYDLVYRAVKAGARLVYAERATVRHPTMDTGRELLKKVWYTNYWAGVRAARRPGFQAPRLARRGSIIPVAGSLRARLFAARPWFGLHRPRLLASGVSPSVWDDVRATFLIQTLISCVAGLGRFAGWWKGRAMDRKGSGPIYLKRQDRPDSVDLRLG